MKKYEVMYIINASVEDDKRAALIESVSNIITTNGGKVNKTDEWGMRDFAYRIDDMTKGYYVVSAFEADNAWMQVPFSRQRQLPLQLPASVWQLSPTHHLHCLQVLD